MAMLKVTAKGVADLGKLMGGGRGEAALTLPPGSTVKDLLAVLIAKFGPALGQRLFMADGLELRKDLRLLLNGREITFLNGLATELKNGDHLSLIPPLAGG